MSDDSTKPSGITRTLLACVTLPLLSTTIWVGLTTTQTLPEMPGLGLGFKVWVIAGLALLIARVPALPSALVCLLLGVGSMSLTLALNFKAVRVEGNSMEDTLLPGDVLLVDTTTRPQGRFEIDVVLGGKRDGEPLIKRLVGLPGEVMDVRYGRVFADGVEVYPRNGSPSDEWYKERPANARFYNRDVQLGATDYFYLGDNPPGSRDSRHFGPVSENKVVGRVVWSLRGSHGFGPLTGD